MRQPIALTPTQLPPDPLPVLPEQTFLPDAYRLPTGAERGASAAWSPAVAFIEVTNRCNPCLLYTSPSPRDS